MLCKAHRFLLRCDWPRWHLHLWIIQRHELWKFDDRSASIKKSKLHMILLMRSRESEAPLYSLFSQWIIVRVSSGNSISSLSYGCNIYYLMWSRINNIINNSFSRSSHTDIPCKFHLNPSRQIRRSCLIRFCIPRLLISSNLYRSGMSAHFSALK